MNRAIKIRGDNVIRFTKDNFDSVIEYYYIKKGITDPGPTSIEKIYERIRVIDLYEFIFISKVISENLTFFKDNLGIHGLTISNLIGYGLDAVLGTESGSKNRERITSDFAKILLKSM